MRVPAATWRPAATAASSATSATRGGSRSRICRLFKHTYRSDLKITTLPNRVKAAKKAGAGIETRRYRGEGRHGKLLPDAIPVVTISNDGSYSAMDYGHDTAPEIDLMASIEHKLGLGPPHRLRRSGAGALRPFAVAHAHEADAQGGVQRHSGGA